MTYDIASNDITSYDVASYDVDKKVRMDEIDTNKYLPLSEATYYVMVALTTPLHGYAVMQKVEEISQGTVKIGAGTIYGVFTQLEKEKLIVLMAEDERRKSYGLTQKGKDVLREQVHRLEIMTRNGQQVVEGL